MIDDKPFSKKKGIKLIGEWGGDKEMFERGKKKKCKHIGVWIGFSKDGLLLFI